VCSSPVNPSQPSSLVSHAKCAAPSQIKWQSAPFFATLIF